MTDLLGDLDYVLEYIYNRLLLQWKHETQNNLPEMITQNDSGTATANLDRRRKYAIFLQKKEFGRDAFKSYKAIKSKDTSLLGGEIW